MQVSKDLLTSVQHLSSETKGQALTDELIENAVRKVFDLSPSGIIKSLNLKIILLNLSATYSFPAYQNGQESIS